MGVPGNEINVAHFGVSVEISLLVLVYEWIFVVMTMTKIQNIKY